MGARWEQAAAGGDSRRNEEAEALETIPDRVTEGGFSTFSTRDGQVGGS